MTYIWKFYKDNNPFLNNLSKSNRYRQGSAHKRHYDKNGERNKGYLINIIPMPSSYTLYIPFTDSLVQIYYLNLRVRFM